MQRERRMPAAKRGHRVMAGSLSVPVSIMVGTLIHRYWGDTLGPDFTLAASTVAGSLCTLATICFWDIRGLILHRMRSRREEDLRKPDEDEHAQI